MNGGHHPGRNRHASAVVLGDRGVLIEGRSGSGKSQLALALVAQTLGSGRNARLVGDDQILLHSSGGRLLAAVPPTIAGLVEVRGFGLAAMAFEGAAVIDLAVRLVSDGAPRFNPDERMDILGVLLPVLTLSAQDPSATFAVLARLGLRPFQSG